MPTEKIYKKRRAQIAKMGLEKDKRSVLMDAVEDPAFHSAQEWNLLVRKTKGRGTSANLELPPRRKKNIKRMSTLFPSTRI